jgi:hypothetical protein
LTPRVKNLSDQVKAKAAGDADKGGAWIVRQERIAAFRIARIEMDGHGCAVALPLLLPSRWSAHGPCA